MPVEERVSLSSVDLELNLQGLIDTRGDYIKCNHREEQVQINQFNTHPLSFS